MTKAVCSRLDGKFHGRHRKAVEARIDVLIGAVAEDVGPAKGYSHSLVWSKDGCIAAVLFWSEILPRARVDLLPLLMDQMSAEQQFSLMKFLHRFSFKADRLVVASK